jgi:hypothetical protein
LSKKVSRKNLVKRLDTVFSQYIRLRNANPQGIAECYTCGKRDDWKRLQNGHFQSRKHYGTRWDETNCQVQCVSCNVYKYGEQYKFGVRLDEDFGYGTAERLHTKATQITKYSNNDLQELITKYTNLVKKKMK